MVESKMDLSYVSQANALKRKAVDIKNDIKKMKEILSTQYTARKTRKLKKNKKKTLNFYSTNNLTKSHILLHGLFTNFHCSLWILFRKKY